MAPDTHLPLAELSEYLSPPPYPHLNAYCTKVLGHPENVALSADELLQFFAAKHPSPHNQNDVRYIPRVESMLHGLRHVPSDPKKFLDSLRDHGLVASFDGIKIALIDQSNKDIGPALADAVILGNLELILKTANDLNLEIVLGMYSGDENIALIAPKNGDLSPTTLSQRFETQLQENATRFYADPFFFQANEAIKATYPNDSVGLRGHYTTPEEVNIYNPKRYVNEVATPTITHAKQALGSTIDATENKGLRATSTTIPLLEYLDRSLTYDLDQITHSRGLELEGIFPDELEVRKIALLSSDLKTSLQANPGTEIYLIRFADVLMKHTNKTNGHTKGDHHMIATARIIRRFLHNQGISDADVKIYQHHGSFLLSTNKAIYNILDQYLSEPISFNADFVKREDFRPQKAGQDPSLRANPYLVATTKVFQRDGNPTPIVINQSDLDKLWENVRELQLTQLHNETIITLYSSGLALSLLDNLQDTFTRLFAAYNLKSPSTKLNLHSYRTLKFAELFSYYYTARPQNLSSLLKNLLQNKLLTREDFVRLRTDLSGTINQSE